MNGDPVSRRGFLKLTGSTLGAGWLSAHWPAVLALGQAACSARDAATPFRNLDALTAADLEAVAAQIIPTDETGPGAREAGVIYFIDGALETVMKGAGGFLADGAARLGDIARDRYGKARFSEHDDDAQLTILRDEEQTGFFGAMKFLTVTGMFAMPSHGGNHGKIGWTLLGFDSRHGWLPPFGHYDADA